MLASTFSGRHIVCNTLKRDDDFSLEAFDCGFSVFFRPESPCYVSLEVLLKHYGQQAYVWTTRGYTLHPTEWCASILGWYSMSTDEDAKNKARVARFVSTATAQKKKARALSSKLLVPVLNGEQITRRIVVMDNGHVA
nr:calcium-dependent protein kinase 26 [Tanacetum cinerariifolium]